MGGPSLSAHSESYLTEGGDDYGMSIKIMSQVWELDINHSEMIVLLAMADHADDDGQNCYPSNAYLAWKPGTPTARSAESSGPWNPSARALIF